MSNPEDEPQATEAEIERYEMLKERDRIAGLTRDEMLGESAEDTANMILDDHDFDNVFELVMWGQVGLVHRSTWYLRDDMYEVLDIPKEERRFQEGEKPDVENEAVTVGGLIAELMKLVGTTGDGITAETLGDCAQWKVRMRHVIDDDVILGARIAAIKRDSFYHHVNLIGPKEEIVADKISARLTVCGVHRIYAVRGGYNVNQCNLDPDHGRRHRFGHVLNPKPFETMDEAVAFSKGGTNEITEAGEGPKES